MKTISKTIKTTISKSKYVLLVLLVAFSFSCSTEDGEPGPQGSAGTNGTDGTNGNANVQTIIFDASTFSGFNVGLMIPEITQDIIDNGIVLSYLAADGYTYPIPGPLTQANFLARVFLSPGIVNIVFHNWNGDTHTIVAGEFNMAKFIIIESTSTIAGRTIQGKQQIYNELNQAGVDINDYHAVCDYYGIAH